MSASSWVPAVIAFAAAMSSAWEDWPDSDAADGDADGSEEDGSLDPTEFVDDASTRAVLNCATLVSDRSGSQDRIAR